jgi:hypothetical protein
MQEKYEDLDSSRRRAIRLALWGKKIWLIHK